MADADVRAKERAFNCRKFGKDLNDPDGDLVIRTSDEHLFRCHSHELKWSGMAFCDVLGIPGDMMEPVGITETGYMFYAYLHMVRIGTFDDHPFKVNRCYETATQHLQLVRNLIEMCDKYQATRFGHLLGGALKDLARYFPLEVFHQAVAHGWSEAAKEAIRFFRCLPVEYGDHGIRLGPSACTDEKRHHACRNPSGSLSWTIRTLAGEDKCQFSRKASQGLHQAMREVKKEAEKRKMRRRNKDVSNGALWNLVAELFVCPARQM